MTNIGSRATSSAAELRRARAMAGIRVAFGLVWAVDAALKWLPGLAGGSLLGTLEDARTGQPAPVHAWISWWLHLFQAQPRAWALTLAITETLIAACLILGLLTRLVCAVGGCLSLLIWSTAEGFGGPYHSGSTDISASIIYVLVFAALAVGSAGGCWSMDARLADHLGPLRRLCSRPTGREVPAAGG